MNDFNDKNTNEPYSEIYPQHEDEFSKDSTLHNENNDENSVIISEVPNHESNLAYNANQYTDDNSSDASAIIEDLDGNSEDIIEDSLISISEETDLAKDNCDDKCEMFFTEIIKKKPRKNNTWKKTVALACIVSILGGGSLGLALGASRTLTDRFLIPLVDKTDRHNKSITESSIAFSTEEEYPSVTIAGSEDTIGVFSEEQNEKLLTVSSYADVIDKIEPSVVCISSTAVSPNSVFDINTPYSGSGILFFESDLKYYIVTNYHVVQDAVNVSVSVEKSDPVPAGLIGLDKDSDLAVIYINKSDALKAGIEKVTLAKFGDSDEMKVGDIVLAIGNALGEGNIATNGIISAKDKTIVIQKDVTLTVLQTNAAINPGNSGGPLVNFNGEVIGINTAKISESNTEGMGYSIPSNIAQPIIQDFMDSINRPYIGVQIKTLTPEIATQFNIISAGAIVEDVVVGSPAEKAGIQATDIITGFNDEPILTYEQLTKYVSNCNIGDVVQIKLIRDGKDHITVEIKLEQQM